MDNPSRIKRHVSLTHFIRSRPQPLCQRQNFVDKVFNGEAYDGRGPIATSVTRVAAVLTVSFDLNGATSLTTRDGRDQTLTGTATALTS